MALGSEPDRLLLDAEPRRGGQGREPLSRRARWAIVAALTMLHPALLYGLYPLLGEATNTLVLAGPVVATLLLGIRVGVLFILFNTTVSAVVFWHLTGMPRAEGLPKAFVSLLVTTTVCWGADRLRHFLEQRREMEAALRQAQKLEAVGRLAAGVAHDINNTLNAIMGSTFALRHELNAFGRPFPDLENIALACDRGAQLTRNLLGFARRSCCQEQVFSLNAVVREVLALLTRAVRKDVRFETRLCEPAPMMLGDEAQIEHALMNLCLNALDAMDDQGTVTIVTACTDGRVSVSVADTGSGMEAHVREHAFEPFFTTKPAGRGTGLGLAMVYGTVQAMEGSVALATRPGEGTTITLTFLQAPVGAAPPENRHGEAADPRLLKGATVLIVDDEPLVLRAGVRMLRAMGCKVLAASSAREGLEIFEGQGDAISLLIIDLVMPDMDGLAMLQAVLGPAPRTPVLLASGYPPDAGKLAALVGDGASVAFLAKPYDALALTAAAAKLLPTRVAAETSRTGTE